MKHTRHRHGRSRRRKVLIRAVWMTAAALVIVLAAIITLRILSPEAPVQEVYGDLDTRFLSSVKLERDGVPYHYREYAIENVLIIGVDQDTPPEGKSVYRSGGQADFLLLVSLDRENRTITPVQLDRDTITPINILGIMGNPAGTRTTHLCLAQAYGKNLRDQSRNTEKAVSRLLKGVIIDHYVTVDLTAINLINDALGGVTVTIDEDLSYLDPAFVKGATVRLQGSQAETFVRSRMAVKSDPTNAGRMRRQRTYMQAAVNLLMDGIRSDSSYALRVLDQLGEHVTTDIPQGWLTNELSMYADFPVMSFYTPAGEHRLDEEGFMAFYPDADALVDNLIRMYFRRT